MISVVMPVYNGERYLEEAVRSVAAQTYRDWELLIVDDCSRDRTREIALALARELPGLRYLRNESNLGAAGARNRGVLEARGEWIAFLDGDDRWREDKLERQLEAAARTGGDFLFTGSGFMDEAGRPKDYCLHVPESVGYRELLKQNVISCSSVMLRRELALRYPMENLADMHEDFAVWLQILRDGGRRAVGVDEPLLIYRVTAGSKSGNKFKAGLMTYRVYRYLGIPVWPALYYWSCYIVRSMKKYSHLVT